jgi:flavin reductase (DIM6/NTAB) family NADH-FMN oxidoreductase RutF
LCGFALSARRVTGETECRRPPYPTRGSRNDHFHVARSPTDECRPGSRPVYTNITEAGNPVACRKIVSPGWVKPDNAGMDEKGEFDPREFRSALSAFTTGVTVVTAAAPDGSRAGVTANSFNSVSLNPPMILWSLAKTSRSLAIFEQAAHWAVHILEAHQDDMSNHFAKSGADKFAGLDTETGAGGVPLFKDYATRLQCKTAFMYEGGDHVIFVGEVLRFDHRSVTPLVFHGGKYALAARKTEPAVLSGDSPRDSDISFGEDFLGYLLWRAAQHFQSIVMREPRASSPPAYRSQALGTSRPCSTR